MTVDLDWYAVAALPQREALAETMLKDRGVSVYVPRRRVEVRKRGRLREVRRPLMPGYVFAGVERGREPWMLFDDCSSIIGLVGFGTPPRPARFPAQDIGDIRYAEWRGWYDDARSADARLRNGGRARVDAGDDDERIAGRIGLIVSALSDERIVLQFGSRRQQLPAIVAVRRLDEIAVM